MGCVHHPKYFHTICHQKNVSAYKLHSKERERRKRAQKGANERLRVLRTAKFNTSMFANSQHSVDENGLRYRMPMATTGIEELSSAHLATRAELTGPSRPEKGLFGGLQRSP